MWIYYACLFLCYQEVFLDFARCREIISLK